MDNNLDQCTRLRRLHTRLTEEVRLIKESIEQAEHDGVDTSIETLNTLKSLQSSLRTISLQLEKCPPSDERDISPAALQQEAKALPGARRMRHWNELDEEEDKPVYSENDPE
ncbi:MAG: hypothetical protein NVS2B12_16000 [Ktedonobacteraceae bacterium]